MKKLQSIILILIISQFFFIPSMVQYLNREYRYTFSLIPKPTDISVDSYIVPGVLTPPSNLIKIGLLGDTKDFTGISMWKGAILAAKEVNQAGGILIGGNAYHIGLVSKDTDETNPNLDISKGVTAAEDLINQHDPDFIIGGYRAEALLAYAEEIMDNQIPFLSIGSDADIHCQNVVENYNRYKYFFRTMPLNSTGFAVELITYIITLSTFLGALYSGTVDKVAILREDLGWTQALSAALNAYLPLYGLTVVEDIAFPITVTAPQMASYWSQIDSSGAQITIPIVSSAAGVLMMTEYESFQPACLVAGIDKLSQLDTYWDLTYGSCQYEVIPQAIYNTNKTSLTKPFWDSFLDAYEEEPFSTGAGAYDSIKILIESVNTTQTLNSDLIVGALETYNSANPFHGATGRLVFTYSHDQLEGWPYNTNLFCQWNSYGTKEVVPTYGMIYPDSIATGTLKVPYWGINNLTGSQALPGAFSLSNNANVPDTDGTFNLTWSSSAGASSYSVYYSLEPSLNNLNKIADGVSSPYRISNLISDDYYFVLVAHNSVGEELSNSNHITVDRPHPGSFTLTSDAEDPDPDGECQLIWSESDGADRYSIYGHTEFISEINQSHSLLAEQTVGTPLDITGLLEGNYYFIVEAYNESGRTLSNCLPVLVDYPNPGPFTLSSDAEIPDTDGEFELAWTESEGADNYSLYRHTGYISDINLSVTILADQNAISPFSVSVLTSGDHYFVAIAYNETGNTYSNNVHVLVQLPETPDQEILGYDIVMLISVISVFSTVILLKLRKKLKTIK